MGFECWHVHGLSLIYVANTPMADTIFPCAKCLETIGIKKRDGSQVKTKITWYKIILQIHCIQREEELRVQRHRMLNQNKKNILFHFPSIHLPHNLIKNRPHLRNLLIPSQAQIFYILCKLKYFTISLCKLTTLSRSLSLSLLKYFTFLHENKIKATTQAFLDGSISLL